MEATEIRDMTDEQLADFGRQVTEGINERKSKKARENGARIIDVVRVADGDIETAIADLEGAPYLFNTERSTDDGGEELMSDAEVVRGLITMLNKGLAKKARTSSGNGRANGTTWVHGSFTLEGTLLTAEVDGIPAATWTVPEDIEERKNVRKAVTQHFKDNGCDANNLGYQVSKKLGVNGEGR